MCGICGIISADSKTRSEIIEINSMIKHRGPDDEGYTLVNTDTGTATCYSGDDSIEPIRNKFQHIKTADFSFADVILGHRRLSILDLSPAGHCPMSDAKGKIWITYNGEIYNYIELKKELSLLGFIFRTNSDTEVIINSYLCWGTECLKKFNGMWAFALWDSYRECLFAARDRFGVKPFYYYSEKSLFAFCSEMKPLAKMLQGKTMFSRDKVPFFIIYGNRLNSKDTYIKNISNLPASHYLIYKNGKTDIIRYYDVEKTVTESNKSYEENKLIELLKDSIKLRFRSDVPVGTCLSGGFDSSSIVSISDKLNVNSLNTFSAVWEEPECDESEYIDIVNEKFNCIPNKVIPSPYEFESIFKKINYFQEIPSEGPGLYPQWYVMRKAGEKVKVLLDGQGGDEVFGGYFHEGTYLSSLLRDKKFLKAIANSGKYWGFFRKQGFHTFMSWIFPWQYSKLTKSSISRKYKILRKEIFPNNNSPEVELDNRPPEKFSHFVQNLSYHYLYNVTIPALLHYEDRSSMAHSIESRVPFLDYRIVELGLNLAPDSLVYNGTSRPLFRNALIPFLPVEIIRRTNKLGFPVPFTKWTRTVLKDYVNDTIVGDRCRVNEFINQIELSKNLQAHYNGTIDYSWEIWRLLSLEMILNLYE